MEQTEQWTLCPTCGGKRFTDRVLSVRLAGRNIAEIMDLSLGEVRALASELFPKQAALLELTCELGLAHVPLVQRVDQLSGGELQRLRIADKLWPAEAAGWIIILDEPSSGLHPADIDRLLAALDRIVADGRNTLILVEHNVEVIRQADWIVDFGPAGGEAGGQVLACATPEKLRTLHSPTARALRDDFLTAMSDVEPIDPIDKDDTGTEAATKAWLSVLLGVRSDPPEDNLSTLRFEALTTTAADILKADLRVWEMAGMNIEIASLFIALNAPDPIGGQIRTLAEEWVAQPTAVLWINPYLGAIQHWHLTLPKQMLQAAERRMKSLEIDLGKESHGFPASARVTGPRFKPPALTIAGCTEAIRHALVVGEGYVELRGQSGHPIASARSRYLDLGEGLAAPPGISVAHLMRTHAIGRCPMCSGQGVVPTLDLDLIIADPSLSPDAEGFYTSAALQILRWVCRSIQIPFFRRLSTEGLWDSQRSFRKFSAVDRATFLWGFWSRPGHGSFLAKPKAEPNEVSSWLRWDGLNALVLEHVGRSRNPEWIQAVTRSHARTQCPKCSSTGLGDSAKLLHYENISLNEWIAERSIGEFAAALTRARPPAERDRRCVRRILACLNPLIKEQRDLRLNGLAQDVPCAIEKLRHMVKEFAHFRTLG